MKRIYIVIIIALFSHYLFAQAYTPIDTTDQTIRMRASTEYLANNKQFIFQIKSEYSGGDRSYIKQYFDKLHKQFNEDLLRGEYLFDNRFDKMVNNVISELKSKNPNIPANINVYFSRDLSLNAASMGDNNFVMNIGIFYYLDNEEQLASIMAHEIGHVLLKHSTKSLLKRYLTEQNEVKKSVREVNKEKSNKSEKALSKLKQIMYDEGRFNRQQEYEADSLGFTLFKNTKYHSSDYINTLKLMEKYDSIKPMGVNIETYKHFFDLPSQAFKDDWLKKEDFKSYDYSKFNDKFDNDSLKTHPEIDERIDNIKRRFPELAKEDSSAKASADFAGLKIIATKEQPHCLNYQEEYGAGVYLCLLRLQKDEKDIYYRNWLGCFFSKIYDARKKYTLNRYLDRIDPKDQSESYQQFLSFMWNLRLNEIKNIADYYNKKGS